MTSDAARIQISDAIDMAVYSGNRLYAEKDEAHAWALTVIASNLFELIGEGDTSADRFADGFRRVMPLVDLSGSDIGWDNLSVARAIRNWIDHGLQLDRPQQVNIRTQVKATVSKVAFMPPYLDSSHDDLYRVYSNVKGGYELHFSPTKIWSVIQSWYRGRQQ